jgi:hypothetical protein
MAASRFGPSVPKAKSVKNAGRVSFGTNGSFGTIKKGTKTSNDPSGLLWLRNSAKSASVAVCCGDVSEPVERPRRAMQRPRL